MTTLLAIGLGFILVTAVMHAADRVIARRLQPSHLIASQSYHLN